MTLPRILIPHPIHGDGLARLAGRFTIDAPAKFDEAKKREAFAAADAVIVRNLGIDAALMDASPKLRVIAKHGAGVDNIDIAAATARGVVVASVPGGNADAVAEAAVAMMLAAIRQVPKVHNLVASGQYAARWSLQYEQLLGRTLGLLGIGSIGARVARICSGGFRMKILAYDPGLSADQVRERGGEKVDDLHALLAQSDVVSLHLPYIPATHHVIDAAALRAMKPTAVLVNAARGPLVDEAALVEALNAGTIAGAALDVFETEPPPADAPIFTAKNIVLSPHTAGNTIDAARILACSSADIALAVFAGEKPAGFLNPEVWDKRRT